MGRVVRDRAAGRALRPGVTGMLQSTLGNLPELFVVIFALQKGELVVAQTAIVGSMLANALLVLGLVIVVGARRAPDGLMRFSKRLPRDTATLLLVTVFIIVLLGLSLELARPGQPPRQGDLGRRRGVPADRLPDLGRALPALRPAPARGAGGDGGGPSAGATAPRLSLPVTLALLLAGGVASAFVSDWFVDGPRAGDRPAAPLAGVRRPGDRGDRGQRRREHGRARARLQGPLGPRDLGRQKLGRADRGVPVPAARAGLVRARDDADVRAGARLHRRARARRRSRCGRSPATARPPNSRAGRWSRCT